MARTMVQVFDEIVAQWPHMPALRARRAGRWQATSWREYRSQARRAARAFMARGLEAGQGVAILSFNRPEWFLANLAAILAGGVPAGIYISCSPDQCQYITDHCEAPIIVVEDAAQLEKIRKVPDQLPRLKTIVLLDGSDPAEDVVSWDDLLTCADEITEEALDERIAVQRPDDLCTLIYTSGTTGPPKAVMLSHRNITWICEAIMRTLEHLEYGPDDQVVSYLPLSHIAEQIVSLHTPMHYGGCVWFVESLETLGETLKEARPSMFFAVPRVWEKIQAKIIAAAAGNSGLKKKIGAWARGVGLEGARAMEAGRRRPLFYPLADKLVFTKVRAALGFDRCRLWVTSAAPIALDTLEFFVSLGVPIVEVYGMSEATGTTTIALPDRYKVGKAGHAIPGTELKIAADGEICMRGPHIFKGYFKDEAATAEALDDEGWLHSGDIGTLDADGFVQITDRKKELIVTAGGKNIAPQMIESLLKSIPAVGQAVAIGDRRKFISALIALDGENVAAEAEKAGIGERDLVEVARSPVFHDYLGRQIEAVNAKVSKVEGVKRFVILPSELTPEGGELTPTLKLKRRVIHEKYAAEIDSMYD